MLETILSRILPGFKRLGKDSGFRVKWAESVPPGMNGWVKTHPYQPAMILLALCGG
jgi:hypothetical protein